MRGMIIGLSALAITALPTLAFADGDGALTGAAGGAVAGAVVGGPVGAAVGGVAGGIIGGAASGPAAPGPVVVAPAPAAPVRHPNHDDHKQQHRCERHKTDDGLPGLTAGCDNRLLNSPRRGSAHASGLGLRLGWTLC